MRLRLCAFADEAAEPIAEQISALKENNIPQIELRSVDGINVKDLTDEKAQEIALALKEAGISVWSLGSPLGKSDISADFSQEVAVLKRLLQLCRLFECDKIRVFSFFTKEYARDRQEVTDRMRRLVEIASEQKIRLFHENEKDIYGDVAVRCLDLMKAFYGDHFKCTFDFANFVQCRQDTMEAYEMLKPYIEYVHIKDAKWDTGEVVPAGQGDGNVKEILTLLNESGYKGYLSLEPHLAEFDGLKNLEKNAAERKLTDGEAAYTMAWDALKTILNKK